MDFSKYIFKSVFFYFFLIVSFRLVFAQNPISPAGYYLADPSARSWNNTTLYLYTSTDESCDYWCSYKQDVLYSTDMLNWNVASDVFSSKGNYDQVPYNDKLLFAPDVAKRGDTYYMYFCQPDDNNALGTSISKNPVGKFENGQILNTGKRYSQIDPSVFIDNDGKAYIVWGQGNMKMAVLKEDMRTIDSTTIKGNILTTREHYFHEGAYMTKRNGIYYLIYADESRNKTPSCIGYATSANPFGPYKYRGVIIDNSGCNPGNWNNHGSIFNFKDQWYVFYHRSTHGCQKFRKSCVEKIQFLSDGSIPEVEMTTQGTLPHIEATSVIDAERACLMKGNVRIEKENDRNEKLSKIKDKDQATYKYLNFSEGVCSITIRYNAFVNCKLTIYASEGERRDTLAEVTLKPHNSNSWIEESFDIETTTGIKALTFEFVGDDGHLCDIDWFKFSK